MVTMVIAFCLSLAVLLRLTDPLTDPQRAFMRDLNFLGAEIGKGFASLFLAPIHREQGWTAKIDELCPEALVPTMGDFTSWRYTPFMGVSATGPGCTLRGPAIKHREMDNLLRLMGRYPVLGCICPTCRKAARRAG